MVLTRIFSPQLFHGLGRSYFMALAAEDIVTIEQTPKILPA
jgi:hypothetical protein